MDTTIKNLDASFKVCTTKEVDKYTAIGSYLLHKLEYYGVPYNADVLEKLVADSVYNRATELLSLMYEHTNLGNCFSLVSKNITEEDAEWVYTYFVKHKQLRPTSNFYVLDRLSTFIRIVKFLDNFLVDTIYYDVDDFSFGGEQTTYTHELNVSDIEWLNNRLGTESITVEYVLGSKIAYHLKPNNRIRGKLLNLINSKDLSRRTLPVTVRNLVANNSLTNKHVKALECVVNYDLSLLFLNSLSLYSFIELEYFRNCTYKKEDLVTFSSFINDHYEYANTDSSFSLYTLQEQITIVKLIKRLYKTYSLIVGIAAGFFSNPTPSITTTLSVVHPVSVDKLEAMFLTLIEKDKALNGKELKTRIDLTGLKIAGGWTIVELVTKADLVEEGDFQHHCVGGYSGHLQESSRIFSFRRKEIRHTVQYVLVKNKRGIDYRVVQSQGKYRKWSKEYTVTEGAYLELNIKELEKHLNKKVQEVKEDMEFSL